MTVAPVLPHDDRGAGDVLVLLHGHPFDRRMWAPQLTSLSSGARRVIALDLPGYGQAPAASGTVRTMSELADAVLELLDALEIERFAVVGLSMGGLVAMELGLADPVRVTAVVLAATTAAPVTAAEVRQREARADELEAEGLLPLALDMAGKLFGPTARRDPDLVSEIFAMMLHAPPQGAAAALRGRAQRPSYAKLLPALRPPALVIAGDADPYADEDVVTELVDALPDPVVVRLEGVGHLPNLESTAAFDAAVTSFLATLPD